MTTFHFNSEVPVKSKSFTLISTMTHTALNFTATLDDLRISQFWPMVYKKNQHKSIFTMVPLCLQSFGNCLILEFFPHRN